MSEMSSDYWLSSGVDLAQPKQEIADYVESMGVPVPKRFETLELALEAMRGGTPIIMRSEHPDEYAGASGLLTSYVLTADEVEQCSEDRKYLSGHNLDMAVRGIVDTGSHTSRPSHGLDMFWLTRIVIGQALRASPEVTIDRLKQLQDKRVHIRDYAALTGRSLEEFMSGVSFSSWEHIRGVNMTVVADDAVDDRYHVLAKGIIADDRQGGIFDSNGQQLQGELIEKGLDVDSERVRQAVELYETVRNLGRFANGHCPIIEMQMDQTGQIWFLQYHRSRDYRAVTDRLAAADYDSREGWIKADAVRGALAATSLTLSVGYPLGYGMSHIFPKLPEAEEASTASNDDKVLAEMLARRRRASINMHTLTKLYPVLADGHDSRSEWFKPEVSVAGISVWELMNHKMRKEAIGAIRGGVLPQLAIELAADGRDAYFRFDPGQPEITYDIGNLSKASES